MSVNVNDTTPAAPSGKTNVKWQHDGSGNVSAYVGSGGGTVTSVGVSMPAEFIVSGSPVTGSGTISVTKANESANAVYAGPTTGAAAAPTFRSLVAADIPNIAESQVTNLVSDLAAKAPLASPAFTGNPTAPTATAGDNDTSIATTAFVQAAVTSGVSGVVVPATEAGASHQFLTAYNAASGLFSKAQPAESDVVNLVSDLAAKAPLASPALTGTPTAPTASPGTNTTQIATTAFVEQEIGPGGSGAYFAWGGDGSDGTVTFDGTSTVLGFVPSANVYTLNRDIFCVSLTLNAGVTIKAGSYAIFCTGTITINGTIHNDGQTGSNGASPVSSTGGGGGPQGIRTSNPAGNDGHYTRLIIGAAGSAGGNGGTTTGTQAAAASSGSGVTQTAFDNSGVNGSTGPSGGKGGTGPSGAGGAVRAGGTGGSTIFTPPTTVQTARHPGIAVTGISFNTTTPHAVWPSNCTHGGAAGGGGGGGDGTNAGGGGGGGGGEGGSGGVVGIFAHTITIGSSGIVRSNGGQGGPGGNGRTPTVGNCGGGGGGAGGNGGLGGIVWLVYHRLTNAGTVQAIGGPGGAAGLKGLPSGTGTNDATDGAAGLTGQAGNICYLPC